MKSLRCENSYTVNFKIKNLLCRINLEEHGNLRGNVYLLKMNKIYIMRG